MTDDLTPSTELDPSDPYQRERQTFPKLTDDQVRRVVEYGSEENLDSRTILFQRGDRGVDFFLVLEGSIELYYLDEEGEPVVFAVIREGQFTGELDLFNNREILVGGRAGSRSRVVRIDRGHFRRMLSAEQDIGELIMRALILRRTGFILHDQAGVMLFGRTNGEMLRLRRFLSRNGYPIRLVDPESEDWHQLIERYGVDVSRTPAVVVPGGRVLQNPCNQAVADFLGLTETVDPTHVCDLAIIGGGPAGLSASVYAASENLDTVVIEEEAPGGQAGTSSRIENYLGFPTGISGRALAARAWIQGQKFGAKFVTARRAVAIDCDSQPFRIELDDGTTLQARAVVVATGARYRGLDVDDYHRFEGRGIHYAATALEAQLCENEEVVVVGGGNSAGQAAVFLASHANRVHLLVRGEGLASSMSGYLVDRIDQSPRIDLHAQTQISGLHGKRTLERVSWSGEECETRDVRNVFVMIGAAPNTDWLRGCLELDARGFIRTGTEVESRRPSSPFTTSVEGVFAVGDVRSGSVKRVASGVGEGSICVQHVHRFLATIDIAPKTELDRSGLGDD